MAIWQYGKIDIAKQKKEKEEDWIITEHALSHALGRQSKTTRERFSSIEHNTTTQDKDINPLKWNSWALFCDWILLMFLIRHC